MKLVPGAIVGLVAVLAFAGCSSHHHHGMVEGGKSDALTGRGRLAIDRGSPNG